MCSSRIHDRLVGQIECYLDDLVECFEEFVKKSMLVISVAVATLVLMVVYILKLMSDRVASTGITYDTTAMLEQFCIGGVLKRLVDEYASFGLTDLGATYEAHTECYDERCQVSLPELTETTANVQDLCTNTKSLINAFLPSANATRTVSLQVLPSTYRNFDDSFTRAIEMCLISKLCDPCKQTQVSEDLKSARIKNKLTTAGQSFISNNHLSASPRNSCCSMCCENERCNNS